MIIRKSTKQDIEIIMEIYKYARGFMEKNKNPNQWGPTNWPPRELILEDIRLGNSYVCEENNQIVGTFYYNYGEGIEPTYEVIEDGNWIAGNKYGVVHRIATNGLVKGVGSFCLNWAYEQSGHLRIDTHPDNTIMQSLLSKLGFTKCGIIYVEEDDYPRFAYEKQGN